MLHAALREVLGPHVKQSGSLVAPDRLRFDFSHFAPLRPHELEAIERRVNEKIQQDLEVATEEMTIDQALDSGAIAFFGEKYGDRVRVVGISAFSMELCGGTHLRQTGQAGLFVVTNESSIASGTRQAAILSIKLQRTTVTIWIGHAHKRFGQAQESTAADQFPRRVQIALAQRPEQFPRDPRDRFHAANRDAFDPKQVATELHNDDHVDP